MKVLSAIAALICSSCTNIAYDYTIVTEIKGGNKNHKYRVYMDFFPSNQVLYTNEKYNVGDTIYFKKTP